MSTSIQDLAKRFPVGPHTPSVASSVLGGTPIGPRSTTLGDLENVLLSCLHLADDIRAAIERVSGPISGEEANTVPSGGKVGDLAVLAGDIHMRLSTLRQAVDTLA